MRHPSLVHEPLADVYRLIRSEHVGPQSFFALMRQCGSAARALEMLPEFARRGGKKRFVAFDKRQAERELAAYEALGAVVIAYGHPHYPALLTQIPDPPPLLIARGRTELLGRVCVGVVGSRHASAVGRAFARGIARELAATGCVVVSGLARGVDAEAHQGALMAMDGGGFYRQNGGRFSRGGPHPSPLVHAEHGFAMTDGEGVTGTVGVTAVGIDQVYPPQNAALYEKMYEQGCVITEQPLGTAPLGRLFPTRNRIIAGMASALLVVEASEKSGSLITARYALEYGREVGAMPGSPLDARNQGSNRLIQEGAMLVQRAEDVLALLPERFEGFGEREGDGGRFSRGGPHPSPLPVHAEHGFGMTGEKNLREEKYGVETIFFSSLREEKISDVERRNVLDSLSPAPVSVDELGKACHVSANVLLTILLELELAGRLERLPGQRVALRLAA